MHQAATGSEWFIMLGRMELFVETKPQRWRWQQRQTKAPLSTWPAVQILVIGTRWPECIIIYDQPVWKRGNWDICAMYYKNDGDFFKASPSDWNYKNEETEEWLFVSPSVTSLCRPTASATHLIDLSMTYSFSGGTSSFIMCDSAHSSLWCSGWISSFYTIYYNTDTDSEVREANIVNCQGVTDINKHLV